MPKLSKAILAAIVLFLSGFFLLLTATNEQILTPFVSVDFDEVCNEDDYLEIGHSELSLQQEADLCPQIVDNKSDLATRLANLGIDPNKFIVISEGQTLHSILQAQEISAQEIFALGSALSPYIRPKDLAPGDLYQFKIIKNNNNSNSVDYFTIKKLDSNRVPIVYISQHERNNSDNSSFKISVYPAAIKEQLELIKITVSGTLFGSFMVLPFGNELMQRLINVFAWRMKMPDEVFSGDQIEILVTKRFAEDIFIGYGRINSVLYKQKQRSIFATYFRSQDNKIDGYFDEHGQALEKEFLLSPVYDTVATSERSWRMHPVMKVKIRHNGIDFRGTIGTPFLAIADGEVIEKRYDKNVGNMIRLRHKYGLHSEYFHANSLVENLNIGQRVKRGQVIGTIGNTGYLCTGPHLHLGIYTLAGEKRKHVDLKQYRKKLLDLANISGPYLKEFQTKLRESTAMMESRRKLIAEGHTGSSSVLAIGR